MGWVSFVAIESYGSLAVALFWSFTNATVDLEAAKASYGLVIAGAQIGAILGGYRQWGEVARVFTNERKAVVGSIYSCTGGRVARVSQTKEKLLGIRFTWPVFLQGFCPPRRVRCLCEW